jgi:hypothetical protein
MASGRSQSWEADSDTSEAALHLCRPRPCYFGQQASDQNAPYQQAVSGRRAVGNLVLWMAALCPSTKLAACRSHRRRHAASAPRKSSSIERHRAAQVALSTMPDHKSGRLASTPQWRASSGMASRSNSLTEHRRGQSIRAYDQRIKNRALAPARRSLPPLFASSRAATAAAHAGRHCAISASTPTVAVQQPPR